ncbi:nitrogenase component 1 [Butyrivibrio fibrisolvens]|jgi:nitrogenase molybdenum-iron protein beta chain|uniref:Nitrogenase molybdenum-iron protein beta chain n=1 Tax=Butyrivibrio fibrisolvens TaxID=831 RepID=A0A1H9S387_BUTFI|nr:nitrogenase component 1 [Butyrivibrio fibrisolvens]SER79404.1 nitrogenase molybdenum-iron protein beta chain [Butyrivibrio fibrisolvens]
MGAEIIEQERFTCALGAMQTVVAIPKALPILHSGPGCGDMVSGFFQRSKGYAGGSTTPCSNFSEKEVVFGGVNRLRELVDNSYKILNSDLQVIFTGCTAGIVGDDVQSVAEEFRDQGKPIVYVESPGFKSNNYVSHSVVVNAIIDQYVSQYEDESTFRSQKNTVNVFASIPYQDMFWRGNLDEYKRLLEAIGLKVNILFGDRSRGVKEWQSIPKANFNILVSPWYGKDIVDHLKDIYGQPYVQYPNIPIGAGETEKFLNKVVSFAKEQGADINEVEARKFIKKESDAYYAQLEDLATFLLEFRYGLPNHAHIIHDAGYVLGLSKFLINETGVIPKEQFIVDDTPEKYQEEIAKELQSISTKRQIPVFFSPDAGKAQNKIRELSHKGKGVIIGAGWDKQIAREKNYDFISAAIPTDYRLVMRTGYVGFAGGLRLIEDIYSNTLSKFA